MVALGAGEVAVTVSGSNAGIVVNGTAIASGQEATAGGGSSADLPTGGVAGQFLKKGSSTDYDASWSSLAISDVATLQTALDARPTATGYDTIQVLTQAAYDALGTPDATTIYIISG